MQRIFLAKTSEDMDKVNTLLKDLDDHRLDYEVEYDDIGEGDNTAVVVEVTWEKDKIIDFYKK